MAASQDPPAVPPQPELPFAFPVPADAAGDFPEFICANGRLAALANDLFRRHFFAHPGPSAYTGDQQSDWREWNALACEWLDTSRHRAHGRDYNADLAHSLEHVEMDADGYVYTYPRTFPERNRIGWPFPDHRQSFGRLPQWTFARDAAGWERVSGGDGGHGERGWRLAAEGGEVEVQSPAVDVEAALTPFVAVDVDTAGPLRGVLLWEGSGGRGQLAVRAEADADGRLTLFLPLWRHLEPAGVLRRFRLRFYLRPGQEVTLGRVECLFDTRHSTNNSHFVMAAWRHALWGADRSFLLRNVDRVRRAIDFLRRDLGGDRLGFLEIPWWGHDGLTGLGHGIGSNYWDLLPMGHRDLYGSGYYLGALQAAAQMEALLEGHPGWGAPPRADGATARTLAARLRKGRARAAAEFWDAEAGRFVGTIDVQGGRHDYGLVFANLEALYYGLGGTAEARQIYAWLDGERRVPGDDAWGPDVYHWRFAPRATTLRNLDWYCWVWNGSQVPWGDQVQDGGAVLYTSYYDIMDRLRWQGPDPAMRRLAAVLDWYEEVESQGGYRAYYATHEGSLQGAGTAGGLGIDAEFVESALVPLTLLYGFLGVEATPAGLSVRPRLPAGVPWLGVRHLRYAGGHYHVLASREGVWIEDADNGGVRRLPARGHHAAIAAPWEHR